MGIQLYENYQKNHFFEPEDQTEFEYGIPRYHSVEITKVDEETVMDFTYHQ